MNNISSSTDLIRNTYNLIHLARETAFANGRTEQAEKLSPVVDDLKKMVEISKETASSIAPAASTVSQSDFQALLKAVESSNKSSGEQTSVKERNQIVLAMAAGGMQDLDIARQMGMTRDEVKTLIQLENLNRNIGRRYE